MRLLELVLHLCQYYADLITDEWFFSTVRSNRLRIYTPHADCDSWVPRAPASVCSLVRRGERNRGKGECRYTASVLRRRMRRLLESEIVTQSVYNTDAEWDGECCWIEAGGSNLA